MNAQTIRIQVELQLSQVEFEMLADYADAIPVDICTAACDMMLIGLTLGADQPSRRKQPENFAPAAGMPTAETFLHADQYPNADAGGEPR
jgi:hypothetical protein